jgi:hypothetical protein
MQHVLPTNAHKTYKLLKYEIHKNVILSLRRVSVYAITPSSGVYQMYFLCLDFYVAIKISFKFFIANCRCSFVRCYLVIILALLTSVYLFLTANVLRKIINVGNVTTFASNRALPEDCVIAYTETRRGVKIKFLCILYLNNLYVLCTFVGNIYTYMYVYIYIYIYIYIYTVEPLITDTAGEFKFCPL